MNERANGTMARVDKGPVEAPPALDGQLGIVANSVSSWPRVVATVHWNLFNVSEVDGIDFYVEDQELGHIHLDGSIHLATNARLGAALVEAGIVKPFSFAEGWVQETVANLGPKAAIELFQRNYEELMAST